MFWSSFFKPTDTPLTSGQSPAKNIQGKIWKSGFENGQLRGQIFDDAVTFFDQCSGLRGIYSSGSIMVTFCKFLIFAYFRKIGTKIIGQGKVGKNLHFWLEGVTGDFRAFLLFF